MLKQCDHPCGDCETLSLQKTARRLSRKSALKNISACVRARVRVCMHKRSALSVFLAHRSNTNLYASRTENAEAVWPCGDRGTLRV